jgi:hypothetical protein
MADPLGANHSGGRYLRQLFILSITTPPMNLRRGIHRIAVVVRWVGVAVCLTYVVVLGYLYSLTIEGEPTPFLYDGNFWFLTGIAIGGFLFFYYAPMLLERLIFWVAEGFSDSDEEGRS